MSDSNEDYLWDLGSKRVGWILKSWHFKFQPSVEANYDGVFIYLDNISCTCSGWRNSFHTYHIQRELNFVYSTSLSLAFVPRAWSGLQESQVYCIQLTKKITTNKSSHPGGMNDWDENVVLKEFIFINSIYPPELTQSNTCNLFI